MRSLISDEAGQAFNTSVQECAAAGIEVLTLHHNRKAQDGKPTRTVDDVYGSTFITAGQGSVLAIDGRPGDLVVRIRQPKPAADEIAPVDVRIRTDTGLLEPLGHLDIAGWIATRPDGTTARDVARYLFGGEPSRSEIEKARRSLNRLLERRHLTFLKDGQVTQYFATTKEEPT